MASGAVGTSPGVAVQASMEVEVAVRLIAVATWRITRSAVRRGWRRWGTYRVHGDRLEQLVCWRVLLRTILSAFPEGILPACYGR